MRNSTTCLKEAKTTVKLLILTAALLLFPTLAVAQVQVGIVTDAQTFGVGETHVVDFTWATSAQCHLSTATKRWAVWLNGQQVIISIPITCAPAAFGPTWQSQTCLVGPIPQGAHGKWLGIDASARDSCGNTGASPTVWAWM